MHGSIAISDCSVTVRSVHFCMKVITQGHSSSAPAGRIVCHSCAFMLAEIHFPCGVLHHHSSWKRNTSTELHRSASTACIIKDDREQFNCMKFTGFTCIVDCGWVVLLIGYDLVILSHVCSL